jgi:hypothetical protein
MAVLEAYIELSSSFLLPLIAAVIARPYHERFNLRQRRNLDPWFTVFLW